MLDVTQLRGDRIFVAMARLTGKSTGAFRRALNASGNVIMLVPHVTDVLYYDTMARQEGLKTVSSSLDAVTYKTQKGRRIDIMTWAKFEQLVKKKNAFAGFGRVVEMIGLEPWEATSKQVEMFNNNPAQASTLILMGTPKPHEGEPHMASRLYHSGHWQTYKIRMVDTPWHDHQVAAKMIAEIGFDRALCEVLAEVPMP